MSSLYCQTFGQRNIDLVLLHGWGLNAEVWNCITARLTPHFRLHLIDLPGYGRSQQYGKMNLDEMTDVVLRNVPTDAVWLGWSMGGLVASKAALKHPERIKALITVASSPCFIERKSEGWPGIKLTVLNGFEKQLSVDFRQTVIRFLELQTLGSPDAREDANKLKQVILNWPLPTVEVLNNGLNLLVENDLRVELAQLTLPFLRIYGAQDGLVPRKIVSQLDQLWPQSHSCLINHAAHAPFISHPDTFCNEIVSFINNI